MVVTPLRDGMNLVAKEYVAARARRHRRAGAERVRRRGGRAGGRVPGQPARRRRAQGHAAARDGRRPGRPRPPDGGDAASTSPSTTSWPGPATYLQSPRPHRPAGGPSPVPPIADGQFPSVKIRRMTRGHVRRPEFVVPHPAPVRCRIRPSADSSLSSQSRIASIGSAQPRVEHQVVTHAGEEQRRAAVPGGGAVQRRRAAPPGRRGCRPPAPAGAPTGPGRVPWVTSSPLGLAPAGRSRSRNAVGLARPAARR